MISFWNLPDKMQTYVWIRYIKTYKYYLPRAAPRAIESLVGQSNIFLFAGSPVVKLNFRITDYQNISAERTVIFTI